MVGTVRRQLTDRHVGTSFFNAAGGGDRVMFQHICWFFGHTEGYIMILPSFGSVCIGGSSASQPVPGKVAGSLTYCFW